MTILKIILIVILAYICFQDIKERQIYWILLPIVAGLCSVLFYKSTLQELFFNAVLLNFSFVLLLILIIFVYSKIKHKSNFFNVIGLGDVLLFFGLALSFSTISFIVIFISALIFSLALHLLLKQKSTFNTIPLAGYMSLFFAITYISFWSGVINGLYTL